MKGKPKATDTMDIYRSVSALIVDGTSEHKCWNFELS